MTPAELWQRIREVATAVSRASKISLMVSYPRLDGLCYFEFPFTVVVHGLQPVFVMNVEALFVSFVVKNISFSLFLHETPFYVYTT